MRQSSTLRIPPQFAKKKRAAICNNVRSIARIVWAAESFRFGCLLAVKRSSTLGISGPITYNLYSCNRFQIPSRDRRLAVTLYSRECYRMIKLLLVEDESATRKGLMKHIKWHELGVDVVEEAKDGIDGLEAARRMQPDIVISDIRMPGMNGIDFTAAVREEFPACKIIFLSGHSDKEYLKAAIRINAVSYVEKPINVDELREVIAKAVRLCRENLKVDRMQMALSESLPFIRQNIVNGLIRSPIDERELRRSLQLGGVSFAPATRTRSPSSSPPMARTSRTTLRCAAPTGSSTTCINLRTASRTWRPCRIPWASSSSPPIGRSARKSWPRSTRC